MRTAQETFLEMIATQIAPGLRALGCKGSGQNYELPSSEHWAMLGFQKSSSSDARVVRFTINVLVVSHAAWEKERKDSLHLPPRPTPNT